MRRITLGAALAAIALVAATATAAPAERSRPAALGPHVYSTRIVGATPALLDTTCGKRLTLTVVREPCAGRRTILTKPFTQIL